jgi:hypothetical protein
VRRGVRRGWEDTGIVSVRAIEFRTIVPGIAVSARSAVSGGIGIAGSVMRARMG